MKALIDIVRAQSLKTLWDNEAAEEQLKQEWWQQQDSDDEWIAQQENEGGHDPICWK